MEGFNFDDFDRDWTQLGREICQAIYTDPKIQDIKYTLDKNGFLTLDQKSEFINTCDRIKYEMIYKKYGVEGTETYKEFSKTWQMWFKSKGVESQKVRVQRSSVDHILFGSTPDPSEFLHNFEQEMLGAMSSN